MTPASSPCEATRDYAFVALDHDTSRSTARAYLALGVAALIGSGLLALILVLARTPGLSTALGLAGIFRAALVVHVDLSVLIWFMAFAGVIGSLAAPARSSGLARSAWGLAAAGTAVLCISPFAPDAQPVLNNYIPVLDHPVFGVGLGLCGMGFGLMLVGTLAARWSGGASGLPAGLRPLALGALGAGLLAWLTFGLTLGAAGAPTPQRAGFAYYELLFWGAGHVLQFQHALLALVAWYALLAHLGARLPAPGTRAAQLSAGLALLPLLSVPVLWVIAPHGSPAYTNAYARLMEWGHLFMLPAAAWVAAGIPTAWRAAPSPARSALLASVLLFSVGGFLAFMIRGANVVVPAHYHGSIVGVTIAFMGASYVLLPRLGFAEPHARWSRWQPWVYGGGQLMHILGLAWSGGYGVQRKVAGAEQVLTSLPQKLGMGMMGLGGAIAIVGGMMFVLVCLRAMWPRR